MPDEIEQPFKRGGKWYIYKDQDDKLFYKGDCTVELTDAGTTAVSVTTIVKGVEVLQAAQVQGMEMVVKLGGLDVSAEPENFCTFRVQCANGEQFDKTIWFKRKDR